MFCNPHFSNDSLWTSRLPKLVFVQMENVNGNINVKAPGMADLEIDATDLEYKQENEISSKMQDVYIKLILCGKPYDEWFSTFLKGMQIEKLSKPEQRFRIFTRRL